jgi:hypothetical protein
MKRTRRTFGREHKLAAVNKVNDFRPLCKKIFGPGFQ